MTIWGVSRAYRLPYVIEHAGLRVGDIVRPVDSLRPYYGKHFREYLVTGFNQVDSTFARVETTFWPREDDAFSTFGIFEVVRVRTTHESLAAIKHLARDQFGAFERYVKPGSRSVSASDTRS